MSDFIDDPDYYAQMGDDLVAQGLMEEAARAFEMALRLNPDSAVTHYCLAYALCELDRREAARFHYQEAARLDPADPDPWLGLGWLAMKEENIQEECDAYEHALQIQPDCITALNNLGIVYRHLGLYAEAIHLLQRARDLAPEDVERTVEVADTFRRSGDLDSAVLAYQDAMQAYPEQHGFVWQLGMLFFDAEQFTEALQTWERLLPYREKVPDLLVWMGDALMYLKRLEEALALYRQATEENPLHAIAYNHRGLCYSELERQEEAATSYQEALRLEPEHQYAYTWLVNLGISLDHLERYEEARRAYRRALELRPEDVDAHVNLGVNYAWDGQREESITAYQEALHLDPKRPLTWANLANQLYEAERDEEAIAACRSAISLKAEGGHVYYILGKMMADRHLWCAARFWWKRGLKQRADDSTPKIKEELRKARKRRDSVRGGGKRSS